jgi:hypothetical protein
MSSLAALPGASQNPQRETRVFRKQTGRKRIGLFMALAAPLVLAAPSHAAGLTASATNCPTPAESQIFAPWGDTAEYTAVPGGSFETGDASWNLSGGAATVAGNESFFVNSPTDSQSLALPTGSSATSTTFCVGVNDPDIRLFAENTGDPKSTLGVTVNFFDAKGLPISARIANITAGGAWAPTAALPILVNLLTLAPNNQTPVSLTFTPSGAGAWQIDDVYMDPFGRT